MKRLDFLRTLGASAMVSELQKLPGAIRDAERTEPAPVSGSSLYETSRERAESIKQRAIEAWLNEDV